MTRQAVATFNTGSSSIKFSIFEFSPGAEAGVCLLRGAVRNLGSEPEIDLSDLSGKARLEAAVAALPRGENIVRVVARWLQETYPDLDVIGCGHRIVHGGPQHAGPAFASSQVLAQLQMFAPFAPAHQPQNLSGLHVARSVFPSARHTISFDTAFHRTVPRIAQIYALPRALTEEGILRYGFHGLAFASVIRRAGLLLGGVPSRTLALHLGSGTSGCAMLQGRSVATTMGLTALDGLPMATRCGDLDPGVVLYLRGEKGLSHEEVSEILYQRSGLRGVSGLSGNMRMLLESDSPDAKEAVDLYCYRIAREAGSLISAMGGIDALVFSGGVGENSGEIRRRIVDLLSWAGLQVDKAQNALGGDIISPPGSACPVLRIVADEETIIAEECMQLLHQV